MPNSLDQLVDELRGHIDAFDDAALARLAPAEQRLVQGARAAVEAYDQDREVGGRQFVLDTALALHKLSRERKGQGDG